MIVDFSGMIADFAVADEVQLMRFATGAYDGTHFRYTAGSTTTSDIVASVQSPTAAQLMQLPEGQRVEDSITVYTSTLIQTAQTPAGAKADRLIYRGKTYEVQKLFDWSPNGNFFAAICTLVAS